MRTTHDVHPQPWHWDYKRASWYQYSIVCTHEEEVLAHHLNHVTLSYRYAPPCFRCISGALIYYYFDTVHWHWSLSAPEERGLLSLPEGLVVDDFTCQSAK